MIKYLEKTFIYRIRYFKTMFGFLLSQFFLILLVKEKFDGTEYEKSRYSFYGYSLPYIQRGR